MFKTVIAGATALSLTLSTPASATGFTDDQVGSFFIGLLGTAAILHLIENSGGADKSKVEAIRTQPKPTAPTVRALTHPRHDQGVRPRHDPRVTERLRKTLPARCLKTIETRSGEIRLFTRKCIQRHYDFRIDFPQHCERSIRTRDGRRNGWGARCMRQAGYRVERHR